MKYRRLPVEWKMRIPGFNVEGAVGDYFINVIRVGRVWWWSLDHLGAPLATGRGRRGGPQMAARVAGLRSLRRHLGLIDCREGWRRLRAGYEYGTFARGALISISPGEPRICWVAWADAGVGGEAPTPEEAAEAAEKALGVHQ